MLYIILFGINNGTKNSLSNMKNYAWDISFDFKVIKFSNLTQTVVCFESSIRVIWQECVPANILHLSPEISRFAMMWISVCKQYIAYISIFKIQMPKISRTNIFLSCNLYFKMDIPMFRYKIGGCWRVTS